VAASIRAFVQGGLLPVARYSRGDWLDFHKLTSHYSGGPMVDIKPQAGAGLERHYASEEESETHASLYVLSLRNYQIIFAPIWI
jgi:hypothetical protein